MAGQPFVLDKCSWSGSDQSQPTATRCTHVTDDAPPLPAAAVPARVGHRHDAACISGQELVHVIEYI